MNSSIYLPLALLVVTSLFGSSVFAQVSVQHQQPVMVLDKVAGKALLEMPGGKRIMATSGMRLSHGAKLMVLERGHVNGTYLQSRCKVAYGQNTVLNVRHNAQCAAGLPVIDANKYANFGTGGNQGCCVTRTITVPVKPAAVAIPPQNVAGAAPVVVVPTATAGISSTGSYLPYVLGGVAGIAILSELLDDDDDNESPASR